MAMDNPKRLVFCSLGDFTSGPFASNELVDDGASEASVEDPDFLWPPTISVVLTRPFPRRVIGFSRSATNSSTSEPARLPMLLLRLDGNRASCVRALSALGERTAGPLVVLPLRPRRENLL